MSDTQTKPQANEERPVTERVVPSTTLLSSISYNTPEDLENFLAKLTPEHSVLILIAAANHCQAKGVFNLEEAELLAKAIKKLSTPTPPPAPK